MNKIYLTSDIHSKNTVFEILGDKITKDTPLYILGDVLNHKESTVDEYRLMIRNIYEGIRNESVVLLTGNHDILTYQLISCPNMNSFEDAKAAFYNLCNMFSAYAHDTIAKLFGYSFFDILYDAQSECIDIGTSLDDPDYLTIVEDYYQTIEDAIKLLNEEELEILNMVKYMAKTSKNSERLTVGDHVLFLSHTGDENDQWSTKIYEPGFIPSDEVSFYVVGHIDHNSISQLSGEDANYCQDCNLDFISGKYVYNFRNKVINIDDGSNCNIVELIK